MKFLFKFLSIYRNSSLDFGSVLFPFSLVTNSTIGNYTYISYFAKINNTRVGKFCSIGQNVKMGLGRHPSNYISTNPLLYSIHNPLGESWVVKNSSFMEHIPVNVGNDVWIGSNVTILDGVTIGDGAILGANSLVTKDVLPYSVVGGVPAKLIKMRFENEVILKFMELQWWDFPKELLKKCASDGLFSENVDMTLLESMSKIIESYHSKLADL